MWTVAVLVVAGIALRVAYIQGEKEGINRMAETFPGETNGTRSLSVLGDYIRNRWEMEYEETETETVGEDRLPWGKHGKEEND